MNRGDVIQVNWPYSDMQGAKVRPSVVVQADFLNSLIDDTILVQITSTRHGIPGTEVLIDPAVEINSGLSHPCYANCMNLLTRDQGILGPVIGYLSANTMQRIEDCLRQVLGIP